MREKMEKSPERKDEEPFARPFVRSEVGGGSNMLREIEGRPDKIIRSTPVEPLIKAFRVERAADAAARMKQLFDELRDVYDIVAPVDFVVGKDRSGADALFAVTDKIKGGDLLYTEFAPAERVEVAKQADELFASLMRYLSDKKRNHEFFFWDILKGSQYVYGTRDSESQKRIYLVDVDPFISAELLPKELRENISEGELEIGLRGGC